MATWLDGNKIAWVYEDEFGTSYLVRATKALTDQHGAGSTALQGGTATDATTFDGISKTIARMRAVKCTSAGFPDKWVPIYGPDAALMTPGT
jgi:hypothetical protein